jgi:hypothetical protein
LHGFHEGFCMPENGKPSVWKRIDNFVRGLANGMTFGLADYIAGAADGALRGGGLSKNIKEQLQKTTTAQNEGPEVFVGNVVGSLSTGLSAASATMGGIANARRTYTALNRIIKTNANFDTRVAARVLKDDIEKGALYPGLLAGNTVASGSSVLSIAGPSLGTEAVNMLSPDPVKPTKSRPPSP